MFIFPIDVLIQILVCSLSQNNHFYTAILIEYAFWTPISYFHICKKIDSAAINWRLTEIPQSVIFPFCRIACNQYFKVRILISVFTIFTRLQIDADFQKLAAAVYRCWQAENTKESAHNGTLFCIKFHLGFYLNKVTFPCLEKRLPDWLTASTTYT